MGCEPLFQNQKFLGVEIDLVVKSPNSEIWIVEVKSLSSNEYLETRLTPRQVGRIRRVLENFLERGQPARAHLALVTGDEVRMFWDFFVL